jgi:hypothetical protein
MEKDKKKGFLASNLTPEEMSAPKVDSTHVEDFQTPEQIAAAEADETGAVIGHHDPEEISETLEPIKEEKPPMKQRLIKFYKEHKKLCIAGGVLLILALIAGGYFLLKPDKPKEIPPIKVVKAEKKITTVPSTLTGVQVDPSTNLRPVTGIMIENSLDSRPQSGLGEAGVVFEAIAEGGITRFLALFQDTAPNSVGPVRSARPYYIQWALGFDATYAHVGGSPEALANIKAWGVKDLDQFRNSSAYQRLSSREAPHNVYTGIPALNKLEASKGFTSSTYTGFARDLKEKPAKVPTAQTISLDISGPSYNVRYNYNPATNSYNRFMAGAPHVDANNNAQISPKVVIGLITSYGIQSDGKHSVYGVIGSGQASIFQNGTVQEVTWTKTDAKTQIKFTDANGAEVKLAPGKTWITALGSKADLTYAP